MRSKHLSVRKCIDKKPDKIKGIVCICIILAVVCAGNMIPNYLISLKSSKNCQNEYYDKQRRYKPLQPLYFS